MSETATSGLPDFFQLLLMNMQRAKYLQNAKLIRKQKIANCTEKPPYLIKKETCDEKIRSLLLNLKICNWQRRRSLSRIGTMIAETKTTEDASSTEWKWQLTLLVASCNMFSDIVILADSHLAHTVYYTLCATQIELTNNGLLITIHCDNIKE